MTVFGLVLSFILFQPRGEASLSPVLENSNRVEHAKEIAGSQFAGGLAGVIESSDIQAYIEQVVRKGLKGPLKPQAWKITRAILSEAARYEMDPLFLLAVIRNESSFNPKARGSAGEIGLMQIKPSTAQWVSKKLSLTWDGPQSLENPFLNIRLGSFYLNHLRAKWDSQAGRYLAAYNMGCGGLYRALGKNINPEAYASRVMKFYLSYYSDLQAQLGLSSQKLAKN